MTPKISAVLGKGGAGKTLVAAHLAMAFDYLGAKTLLVGCDQKQDTVRAVSNEMRGGLMEWLEQNGFDYARVKPEQVILPVTKYVDAIELGASQLLVGNYASVFDEAFHYFKLHGVFEKYEQVLFDVTDERWDAMLTPLFRRAHSAIAVTRETPEGLFVTNRLVRSVLIGAVEFHHPMALVGVINNRSRDPVAFERYVERTRVFPLLRIPDTQELAGLRPFHRTLFALSSRAPAAEQLHTGFIKIAELLRGEPMNLYNVSTLEDDDVWKLAPPVSLPS